GAQLAAHFVRIALEFIGIALRLRGVPPRFRSLLARFVGVALDLGGDLAPERLHHLAPDVLGERALRRILGRRAIAVAQLHPLVVDDDLARNAAGIVALADLDAVLVDDDLRRRRILFLRLDAQAMLVHRDVDVAARRHPAGRGGDVPAERRDARQD